MFFNILCRVKLDRISWIESFSPLAEAKRALLLQRLGRRMDVLRILRVEHGVKFFGGNEQSKSN